MKKLLTEFIGTFFLVLTAILAKNNGNAALAPLAIGFTFAGMMYTGGSISKGFFNPAIALAMLLRGRLTGSEFTALAGTQLVGGTAGAALAAMLLRCTRLEVAVHSNEIICSLVAEFLGAFALIWVILHVVRFDERGQINPMAPLAVGFITSALIFGLGSVSGGAFNPALAVGMILAGALPAADWWIYFLAAALAAAAASSLFQVFFGIE